MYKVMGKRGVTIKGKYGIPKLSTFSKISIENEILSQRGVRLNPPSHPLWFSPGVFGTLN